MRLIRLGRSRHGRLDIEVHDWRCARSVTTRFVYDWRHAAATTWLCAGVPLGGVMARMGHSVETLVSTYVGVLNGDEAIANERIDAVLVCSTPVAKMGR